MAWLVWWAWVGAGLVQGWCRFGEHGFGFSAWHERDRQCLPSTSTKDHYLKGWGCVEPQMKGSSRLSAVHTRILGCWGCCQSVHASLPYLTQHLSLERRATSLADVHQSDQTSR